MHPDSHMLSFYWNVLKTAISKFVEQDVLTHAAALAYYMVFSLPPMLFILFWTSDLFYKKAEVQEAVFIEFGALVGEDGAQQIMATIERLNIQAPTWWASLMAVGVLLFTASTVLVTMQTILNRIFDVPSAQSAGLGIWRFIRDRIISFAMLITLSFILYISLIFDALIIAVDKSLTQWIGEWTNFLIVIDSLLLDLAVMTLLFAMMFRYLPDKQLMWKDTWFGAMLTALLFAVGQHLITIYIGNSEVANLYDTAGSLLVLMLWVYYTSAIFLFGATFTASRINSKHSARVEQP